MSKMGSHDPSWHSKHKLWPKERARVKLTIWLPTTKSHESTRFPCFQVAWDIPLKSSPQGLQLCFRPHLNWRPTKKVIGPQSCKSPKLENFPGQKAIWMWPLWRGTKYTIRGKVVASPKSRPWWVLWVQVCSWLILAPKVFTNHLVLVLCRSVWVVEACQFLLVPKCYKLGSAPRLFVFPLFYVWDSHLSASRS
jgi:hypothetical protein